MARAVRLPTGSTLASDVARAGFEQLQSGREPNETAGKFQLGIGRAGRPGNRVNRGIDAEASMTAEKLQKYRIQLLDLLSLLIGDLRALDESIRSPTGSESRESPSGATRRLADLGAAIHIQEAHTLREKQEYLRRDILVAIERVENGSYGLCERCGQAIIDARLELLPYTPFCSDCSIAVRVEKRVLINDGQPQRSEDSMDVARVTGV
jgi:RNA polymerase-binding transcription factor DksA